MQIRPRAHPTRISDARACHTRVYAYPSRCRGIRRRRRRNVARSASYGAVRFHPSSSPGVAPIPPWIPRDRLRALFPEAFLAPRTRARDCVIFKTPRCIALSVGCREKPPRNPCAFQCTNAFPFYLSLSLSLSLSLAKFPCLSATLARKYFSPGDCNFAK